MKHVKYYYDKYHFQGLFNGFYNHFDLEEERWGFTLELMNMIFNIPPQKPTYEYLTTLLKKKPFHIVTTNQDMIFKKFFGKEQVSEIQGSWSYFQSSNPDTDKHLYSSQRILDELLPKVKDHRLAADLIPKSRVDGAPLTLWARGPEFLEDKLYNEEYQKINHFLGQHRVEKILFLEMGVGRMTPMFIQEPFWALTSQLPGAFDVMVNKEYQFLPEQIEDRGVAIKGDIGQVLDDVKAAL